VADALPALVSPPPANNLPDHPALRVIGFTLAIRSISSRFSASAFSRWALRMRAKVRFKSVSDALVYFQSGFRMFGFIWLLRCLGVKPD
jgi:hypothetical protein